MVQDPGLIGLGQVPIKSIVTAFGFTVDSVIVARSDSAWCDAIFSQKLQTVISPKNWDVFAPLLHPLRLRRAIPSLVRYFFSRFPPAQI